MCNIITIFTGIINRLLKLFASAFGTIVPYSPAFRSSRTSSAVNSRQPPRGSVPSSFSGPMEIRSKAVTGFPQAASIRFTW